MTTTCIGRKEIGKGERSWGLLLGAGLLMMVMGSAGVIWGQTLPAGHPPMSGSAQRDAGGMPGALPPGHPAMNAGQGDGAEMPGALPPGHPSMGGQPGAGDLPTSHGPLEELMGTSTQPKVAGKLTVVLVAGTAGGQNGASDDVSIELYHRGTAVKKYESKADAGGKVIFGDLPVMPPVEVLVSVKHAGFTQQVVTPELNPTAPEQAIEMKVFETTEAAPAWSVAMQHMIVQWNPEGKGIHVMEMISASTPGDRAWLGARAGDGRQTMSIPLPPGAENIELGGSFDEALTKLVDGSLESGGALFPGRSEYRISYSIAAQDGAVKLPISGPAAVENLIVFVPANGGEITATGLEGGKVVDMGDGQVRMYRAQNLEPGKSVMLAISAIPAAEEAVANAPAAAATWYTPRNIALAGVVLLVLGALGMMFMRKPAAKKA